MSVSETPMLRNTCINYKLIKFRFIETAIYTCIHQGKLNALRDCTITRCVRGLSRTRYGPISIAGLQSPLNLSRPYSCLELYQINVEISVIFILNFLTFHQFQWNITINGCGLRYTHVSADSSLCNGIPIIVSNML